MFKNDIFPCGSIGCQSKRRGNKENKENKEKKEKTTSDSFYVYYREVKSLGLIENSHNTTLTFLFGAVLTDNFLLWGIFDRRFFYYGAVLTENSGRFE